MKRINLLLPIETIARELDYKLFLAVSLAKRGVNVIIAQADFFNTRCYRFKGGVFIGKSVFKYPFIYKDGKSKTVLRYYNELKNNDITFLHLEEEGAIWFGGEEEWKKVLDYRLNPDVLKDMDYIFSWGSFQAKHFQNKSSLFPSAHIIDSGHPKHDLGKPKYREYYKEEIDKIKKKYGAFILINTKVGAANNVTGIKGTFQIPEKDWLSNIPNPSEERVQVFKEWAYQTKVLANFVTLLHKLSINFPNKTFVVRPHPGEDPEFYRHVFVGMKNIHVEKSGSVHPWIMAADLVIHDECTTGVEAYLAEVPTISYKSVENKELEIILPNQCGVECKTIEEVIKAIYNSEQDPETFAKKNSFTTLTKSLMKNIESETYNDFICTVDKIIEEKRSNNAYSGKISIFKLRLEEAINELEQLCRTMIRRFFPLKRLNYLSSRAHFPGFDKKLIESNICSIERILNKKVVLKFLSSRLMVVTSADDRE